MVMDAVIEHVFAGFMVFLLISTCLFGINTYMSLNLIDSKSSSSLESVFEYLSSMLFSNEIVTPTITSKMDDICSEAFPNAYIDYDSLKDLMDLDDYGFTLSLHYPLNINLDLNGRVLWCSIESNVNSFPVKGTISIYAFTNGSLIDKVTLFVSESGCYYYFANPPEMIIAVAHSNNMWGFNWTGNFDRLLAFPYDGHLYLTGSCLSPNIFLLSESFINGGREVELSSNEFIEFLSQCIRKGVVIESGEKRVTLFLSGTGKIKVSLGIIGENYNISDLFSSEIISVNNLTPKNVSFSLNLREPINLSENNRLLFKISCMEGNVKVYFGSRAYPSRLSLSLIPNVAGEGLYFKLPVKSLSLYLLTCQGDLFNLNIIKSKNDVFRIKYALTPLLILAFSPKHRKYYVLPFPNVFESYGGIPGNNHNVFSKVISILNYPYVLKASLWHHSLNRKIKELSFSINVVPPQISIMPGAIGQVFINVLSLKNDFTTVRVFLNVLYPRNIFRNVTLTKASGLIPFTANLLIQPYENASQGTYKILIMGSDNEGTTVNCEIKVNILSSPPDFKITIKPAILTVYQRSNTSTSIYINSSQSYRCNVSLVANNVPDGVAISFNPSNGVPSFQSACFISVGAVISGTYQIIITGIDENGRNHSSILTLNVIGSPPDFKLRIFPNDTIIQRGRVATFIIEVISINNFSNTVTLKLSNIPPFSFYLLFPPNGNPSFNSTLKLVVSYLTPQRTYYVVVTAMSGSMVRTATIRLRVI